MPNIGPLEIVIIAAIVALLAGPKAIPALARRAGKVVRIGKGEAKEFKEALSMDFDAEPEPREKAPADPPGPPNRPRLKHE
jgi:sec-independent protein translocase protein TatA